MNNEQQDANVPGSNPGEHDTIDFVIQEPEIDKEELHIEHDSSAYPHCPVNHVRITEQEDQGGLRRLLMGRPLRSEKTERDLVGRITGLGIFSADALSSIAYATREMLHILVLAGAAAMSLSLPIAGAICVLLVIITLSYRQIILAYPAGGGSYTVARDNLGMHTAQIAGAALLTDYVLTVAVSISAGVEQLTSAFPVLLAHRVVICLMAILLLTLFNLRGFHGSIKVFAFPSYFFVGMMLLMLAVGFWRWSQDTLPQVEGVADLPMQAMQPLTLLLILRAFSAGSTALTGMKSISARIMTFKEPRSRNAVTTLLAMSVILMIMFMGVTVLARLTNAMPLDNETIISQLARTIFDAQPVFYYLTIAATTIVLLMAANTSFARFPRLAALQAEDGFLPHQFTLRGHRLVFWWGIVVLALCAALLVVIFNANTSALIPLYAIGVFLSFTLAQAGMVMRWRKISRLQPGEEIQKERTVLRHTSRWRAGLFINAVGCVVTAVVTLVFLVTRFTHGAWIVVVVMIGLVWVFFLIKRHYTNVARSLSLEQYQPEKEVDPSNHKVVILVSGVHRGTLIAARYARSLQAQKVVAVHVETDPEQTLKVHERWQKWMPDVPLVVVDSPYRTLFRPLASYINMLTSEDDTELVTIIIPQFVCVRWWHHFLHNQTALMIRSAFLFDRDKVVIEVPFRLEE